jgi:imidazolonepropionase-like amidohydrolase
LIDAHVHYSQTGWVDARPDAVDLRAELPYDSTVATLQRNPGVFDRAWLCSGVTAVFDVGGFPFTMPMQRAHEADARAPRMAAAGPLLTSRAHWLNLPFLQQFVPMTNDSVVKSTVKGLAYMGSAAIKVWYLQLADSLQPQARDMLMIAGEAAKQAGKPLIVHATQLPRAKEALAAGAKVLVHSVETAEIDDEFIAAAKRNGTIVIPTVTVREGYADVGLGRSPAARYPLECVDAHDWLPPRAATYGLHSERQSRQTCAGCGMPGFPSLQALTQAIRARHMGRASIARWKRCRRQV